MTRITVYGGSSEIGGNTIVLESEGSKVLLDFGKSFSREGMYFDPYLQPRTNSSIRDLLTMGLLPPIDGIYNENLLRPDKLGSALKDTIPKHGSINPGKVEKDYFTLPVKPYKKGVFDGLLITHAHMDHADHVKYLHPELPVLATPTTIEMLRITEALSGDFRNFGTVSVRELCKTKGNAIFSGTWHSSKNRDGIDRDLKPIKGPTNLGSFKITPVRVDHSIPGACAYLIETPEGKQVLYTGDFRFHGPLGGKYTGLKDIKNVDVLITEGTRIDTTRLDNEGNVLENINRRGLGEGLVCVGFSWKDITRYKTMLTLARENGRTLVIQPKTAYVLARLHAIGSEDMKNLGLRWPEKDVLVYVPRKDTMIYSKSDYTNSKHCISSKRDWKEVNNEDIPEWFGNGEDGDLGIRAYDIKAEPERYIVQIGYYDLNELLDLMPATKGAMYIRSQTGPLDIEMAIDEERLVNWLRMAGFMEFEQIRYDPVRGTSVVEKKPFFHSHSSGHISGHELLKLIERINPEHIIPVHTEHPYIFSRVFDNVHLPDYGKGIDI